jgi:outer membrane receptor protein involved in Fe transport
VLFKSQLNLSPAARSTFFIPIIETSNSTFAANLLMIRQKFIFLICFNLSFLLGFTQSQNGNNSSQIRKAGNKQMAIGRFSGKVKEANSNEAMEFVSVQLWITKKDSLTNQPKEELIAGMLTDKQGEFSLENLPLMGNFTLKLSAIGYTTYEQKVKFDIDFKAMQSTGDRSQLTAKADKDLGNIKLHINTQLLKEVTVEAEKSLYQMRFDRKVFNVEKNVLSTGGSAQDVMRSIPAVQVDIDGNVTLRNSTPQIFVDGKPTTLTLEQIPADAIESIEIITNPSAKFDAGDSNSGILNIVMKKNKKPGYNGSLRVGAGTRLKYVLGGDLNVKEGKINFFASANLVNRLTNPTTTTKRNSKTDSTSLLQFSKILQENQFNHGRIGFDYFINNRNTITISETLVDGKMNINDNTQNDSLLNDLIFASFERSSNTKNRFRNYGTQLSFKHLFPLEGRELTADINYNSPKNSNEARFETQNYSIDGMPKGQLKQQKTEGGGYNKLVVGQIDFVNPFSEKSKLEAGARVSARNFFNETTTYLFVDSLNDFKVAPRVSSKYAFNDYIYAAYGIYANKINKIMYQVGLRIESSDYTGKLPDRNTEFRIQYPLSLFPSAYLTYNMSKNQDIQLNYSRKINRPNFFQLMPFPDFVDPQNISIGNPELNPEFTNSLDLDYQKITAKGFSFLASIYYKYTSNLITRYQYRDIGANGRDSSIYNTFLNANYSQSYGLELTAKTPVTKWWEIITNVNLYNASINGENIASNLNTERVSAFGKMNWNFVLPKNIGIQISGEYQTRTVLPVGGSSGGNTHGGGRGVGGGGFGGPRDQQLSSSQGYINSNYSVDAAVKWDFVKNVASLSVNVSDVFKTKRFSSFSETPYFTQDYLRVRDQQVIRVNLSFRFGKLDSSLFKRKNNRIENEGMQGI